MLAPGWPAELADGPVTLRPYHRSDARAWSDVRRANERWLAPWEPTPPGTWQELNAPSAFRYVLRELRRAGRRRIPNRVLPRFAVGMLMARKLTAADNPHDAIFGAHRRPRPCIAAACRISSLVVQPGIMWTVSDGWVARLIRVPTDVQTAAT